jgi:hypothetical protein
LGHLGAVDALIGIRLARALLEDASALAHLLDQLLRLEVRRQRIRVCRVGCHASGRARKQALDLRERVLQPWELTFASGRQHDLGGHLRVKGQGFSIGSEEVKQVKYQVKSLLGRNNFSACTKQLSFAFITQSRSLFFDFVCFGRA